MSQTPASPSPPPPPEQPPYNAPAPAEGPEPSKTISILALVFGGAALLFGLIPVAGIFLGGLFGIAAIVLGIVGIFISHRLFAIIGIALAVVGLIVAIIITVAVGKSAEKIIEDWPSEFGDTGTEDAPKDEVVDGTDPSSPLAAGSAVDTGNWKITIGEVEPDATDVVLAEDEFNTPPPDGFQYYLFQVDATYEGADASSVFADLIFGVYANNTVYTDYCGYIPNDISSAPEVYEGGTSSGNACVTVPSEGVEDALITIEDWTSLSGTRYFVEPS